MNKILLVAAVCLLCPSGVTGQDVSRWTLVEDLRYGAVDGPESLTRVGNVILDFADSSLIVAQPQEGLVRVIDARGTLRQIIGRRGSGPAEFGDIGDIGFVGDTLYVVDPSQRRVSFFSRSGVHLQTISVAESTIPNFVRGAVPMALSRGGAILARPMVIPQHVISGTVSAVPLLRMDRQGRVQAVVATANIRDFFGSVPFDNGSTLYNRPLAGRTFLKVDQAGELFVVVEQPPLSGRPGRFRVVVGTAAGDTIFDRGYTYRPIPVPRSVSDSIYAHYAPGFAGRNGTPAEGERAARRVLNVPDSYPPIREALLTPSGSVWLHNQSASSAFNQWTVLNPRGAIQATVRVPAAVEIRTVIGNTVVGVLKDDLDVPYIVRFRLLR